MATTVKGAASRLSIFPAGWDYRLVSNEEKDRLHAMIGELLAEELSRGAVATAELDQLLVTVRAQQCRVWLDDVRSKLLRMLAAEKFLAQHDKAQIDRDVEQTTEAAQRTEIALTDAAGAHNTATRKKDEAAAAQRQFHDAQAQLGTGDVAVQAAWQHSRKVAK